MSVSIKAYSGAQGEVTWLTKKSDSVGFFFCLLLASVASAWLLVFTGSLNAGIFTGIYLSRVLMASRAAVLYQDLTVADGVWNRGRALAFKNRRFLSLRLLVEHGEELWIQVWSGWEAAPRTLCITVFAHLEYVLLGSCQRNPQLSLYLVFAKSLYTL